MGLATRKISPTWWFGCLAIYSALLIADPRTSLAQLQRAAPVPRTVSPSPEPGPQPLLKWVGQDGHDYVGPNNRLEPSEVQDMHFALSGLDPQREISFVDVTTEQGGDQWQYNAQSFAWKAELKRAKLSRSADLFLEPGHVETPRNYHILFRYGDGTTYEFDVRGRSVNRGLRMPGAALKARWIGQDRQDRVGAGPSVGPDGIVDARIRLTGVSTRVPIKSIRLAADVPANERSNLEVLRTDTPTFTALIESRRNRRDDWYKVPAGYIDVCSVPIPVRTIGAAAAK